MLGKRTRGRRRMQMLHDLIGNSDYVTLKQAAAERTMWRYSRGISRTCCTAEDWRKEGRKEPNPAISGSYNLPLWALSINMESVRAVACRLSHLSVCVWKVYCGKMAEWIWKLFGMVSGVGRGTVVLDGGYRQRRRGSFGGGWIWGIPNVTNRDFVAQLCGSAWTDRAVVWGGGCSQPRHWCTSIRLGSTCCKGKDQFIGFLPPFIFVEQKCIWLMCEKFIIFPYGQYIVGIYEQLFDRINHNSQHILQQYLPDHPDMNYSLRSRCHNKTLLCKTFELNDRDFIIRNLYKHCY